MLKNYLLLIYNSNIALDTLTLKIYLLFTCNSNLTGRPAFYLAKPLQKYSRFPGDLLHPLLRWGAVSYRKNLRDAGLVTNLEAVSKWLLRVPCTCTYAPKSPTLAVFPLKAL